MELRSHKWVFHVFVMIDLMVWMNLRKLRSGSEVCTVFIVIA